VCVPAHLAPARRALLDQGADVRDGVAEEDDLVADSRGGRRLAAPLPNGSPSEEAQASAVSSGVCQLSAYDGSSSSRAS
jgi:hypothetical protein